ncbi:hypothetical protein ABZW18_17200 [Streptomyces sp. NPDC004647]|uniref:hypothetical protein n=1 Tax=Streptomyces sp. NPDC004647 TaxID=3154671 RepID=UPI0033B936E6
MPTPYGSRGAMAFSADELRVLRRALAIALQPAPGPPASGREEEVQELFRLTEAVDEAVREGGRLRAFLLADLARYRAALPGAAIGYLKRLQGALSDGHLPGADDLAALRTLCSGQAGGAEAERRRVLLHRCEVLAEQSVRDRLARRARASGPARTQPAPARLVALPGGRAADEPAKPKPKPKPKAEPKSEPEKEPEDEPRTKPEKSPGPPSPAEHPGRPVPTPAEVFPPRRRTTGPPERRPEQLVAG